MSWRTQKAKIYLANEKSGLVTFSTDLGHIFASKVDNEFGVMLRRKGAHKPEFAYDLVRLHSFMLFADLTEYSLLVTQRFHYRDTLPFLKLQVFTTEQYMNYQTFSNCNSDQCSKIPLIVLTLTWETRTLKNTPCNCWYHPFCFDVLKSVQRSFLT